MVTCTWSVIIKMDRAQSYQEPGSFFGILKKWSGVMEFYIPVKNYSLTSLLRWSVHGLKRKLVCPEKNIKPLSRELTNFLALWSALNGIQTLVMRSTVIHQTDSNKCADKAFCISRVNLGNIEINAFIKLCTSINL